MEKFVWHRNGTEVAVRDHELLQRISDLQPRPKNDRDHYSDGGNGGITGAKLQQIASSQPSVHRVKFSSAKSKCAYQIDMGDDSTGARSDRQAGRDTDRNRRTPRG